jgi:diguanylate cyclase (GGDEF)-like protein
MQATTPRKRLTIAARLYLLIGAAALALGVVASAAVSVSGSMVAAGERLQQQGVAGVEGASRLASLFDRQRALVSRAPAETDLDRQAQYRKEFDAISLKIDAARLHLEEIVPPEMQAKVRSLDASFADLRRDAASVFELSANFVQNQAMDMLNGPLADTANGIDAVLQSLVRSVRDHAQGEVEALVGARRALVQTITAVSLVTLGLLLGFGVLLTRSLSGRLRRITAAMTAVSAGTDAGNHVPATQDGDEVGEMARALEVFRRNAVEIAALRLAQERTLEALSIANEEVLARSIHLDAALKYRSQGLLMFDRGERLILCNDQYIDMYGLSRDIVKPGCSFAGLLRHRYEQGQLVRNPEEYRAEILAEIRTRGTRSRVVKTADGREVQVIDRAMPDGSWVATHEDITEQRAAEAKISHMALHDALTDLPNRVLFRQQLEERLAHMERGARFAVLCLDLDRFKNVNDALGHAIGDRLLNQAADRLRACLRDSDIVARFGGDEFAILQFGVGGPTDTTALAERLIEAIGEPFDLDGQQVVIGLSAGIAIAPTDGADADQLMMNADMALYRAKADGRATYRFFEPEMDARMQARRSLELDLRKAVTQGEFELHFQPLINLKADAICSFEALLRWNHPERGMIPPLDFIPLAEETGLIVPIGEWALRQACEEAAKWPSEVGIAVNLSPAQFKSPNLSQTVVNALARSGLAPGRLELEITESVLLSDTDANYATLHRLRELGVRISMDDFGTGYSSLSYLRSFPFDKIKIDRSFVRDLSSKVESIAIIRAVTGLGSNLGMVTTGEGVETQDELECLRQEGCTEAQGYYFSKPRPASEVHGLLAKYGFSVKAVA